MILCSICAGYSLGAVIAAQAFPGTKLQGLIYLAGFIAPSQSQVKEAMLAVQFPFISIGGELDVRQTQIAELNLSSFLLWTGSQ
jgi:predicted esterase